MRRPVFALVIVMMLGLLFSTAMAQYPRATISLGTDPEPPVCVINPLGDTSIFWLIQHSTIPDYVIYKLYTPGHSTLVETETYPGSTGINVHRNWIVPSGAAAGAYWVRIEYYSVGIGLEAAAEVVFLVCQPTPPGVCCIGETCFVLTEQECTQMGGIPHPEFVNCDITICLPPPTPAVCCLGETCQLLLETECATFGGVWHPDLVDCENHPCAMPAVCCLGETCQVMLESECNAAQGIWHPEMTNCDNDPCLLPPTPAVCCVGDVCYVLTAQECSDMGGVFHPEWVDCPTPDPCQPTPTDDMNWGTLKSLYR
jgi:hypothetical protein